MVNFGTFLYLKFESLATMFEAMLLWKHQRAASFVMLVHTFWRTQQCRINQKLDGRAIRGGYIDPGSCEFHSNGTGTAMTARGKTRRSRSINFHRRGCTVRTCIALPPLSPSLSPSSDETDAYTGTMNSRGTDDEGALLKGASKGQERDAAEESVR